MLRDDKNEKVPLYKNLAPQKNYDHLFSNKLVELIVGTLEEITNFNPSALNTLSTSFGNANQRLFNLSFRFEGKEFPHNTEVSNLFVDLDKTKNPIVLPLVTELINCLESLDKKVTLENTIALKQLAVDMFAPIEKSAAWASFWSRIERLQTLSAEQKLNIKRFIANSIVFRIHNSLSLIQPMLARETAAYSTILSSCAEPEISFKLQKDKIESTVTDTFNDADICRCIQNLNAENARKFLGMRKDNLLVFLKSVDGKYTHPLHQLGDAGLVALNDKLLESLAQINAVNLGDKPTKEQIQLKREIVNEYAVMILKCIQIKYCECGDYLKTYGTSELLPKSGKKLANGVYAILIANDPQMNKHEELYKKITHRLHLFHMMQTNKNAKQKQLAVTKQKEAEKSGKSKSPLATLSFMSGDKTQASAPKKPATPGSK